MNRIRLLLVLITFGCTAVAYGQPRLSLDDRYHFVLTGENQPMAGLQIASPSGSLMPGSAVDTGPFSLLLSNRNTDVTYVAFPGSTIEIDGDYTLPARWNPSGELDVQWTYGTGGPTSVATQGNEVFEAAVPVSESEGISLGLDENNRFVISGAGQQVIGIDIQSPSGSLTPGPMGETSEFSFVQNNTAERQTYTVFGDAGAVNVDGDITLSGGWNPFGLADVTYQFNLIGPRNSGLQTLEISDNDRQTLDVRLNDDHQFVVSGTGQSLSQLTFRSTNGALTTADTLGPFNALDANTENEIVFSAPGNITIDGDVTLSAGWNRILGYRDVRYGYTIDGFTVEPQLLPGSIYPTEAPPTSIIRGAVGLDAGLIELTGEGHELRQIQVTSRTGALVHDGVTAAPFDTVVRSSPTSVTLESSSYVVLDDSIVLPVGFDLDASQQDVKFRYTQVGRLNRRGPFNVTYPLGLTPLRSWFDGNGNLVIQGIGHEVEQLEFISEAGALVPGELPDPFTSFVENTANRISLAGNVTLDGNVTLPVQWNESASDVKFTYTLADSDVVLGPRSVTYPPANVISIVAAPGLTDRLVLSANSLEIVGVEIISNSESLVVQDLSLADFGPFDIVEEYSEGHVSLKSTNPVTIDWLRLPVAWDNDREADLQVVFTPAGSRAISAIVQYDGAFVPEPASTALALPAIVGLLGLARRRRSRPAC